MCEQGGAPQIPMNCLGPSVGSPGETKGQSRPGLAGPCFKLYHFCFVELENLHRNHSRTHMLTQ